MSATLPLAPPPDAVPSAIIKEAYALEQAFEKLCLNITSADTAKLFGSDAALPHAEDDQIDDALQTAPRKGSLRVFAQQVVQKVSRKGCTTYQNIADELIAELQEHKRQEKLSAAAAAASQPDKKRRRTTCEVHVESHAMEDDGEKNIRRRVYDSLNVLKAIGAVMPLKDLVGTAGKDIVWVGLPRHLDELNAAQTMQDELRASVRQVQQANEQLQALASQYMLLAKLIQRNATMSTNPDWLANAGSEDRIPLPFIILQAEADAKFDIEMSKDQTVANFNFNRSPFQVLEDYVILQQMGL